FQRQPLSRLQSLSNQRLISAAAQDLDNGLRELRAAPDIGDRAARFAEKRRRRNNNAVGDAVYRYPDNRSHSRREAPIDVRQRHFNAEISRDGRAALGLPVILQ